MNCFATTCVHATRPALNVAAAAALAWTVSAPAMAATFQSVNRHGNVISATADFSSVGDLLTVKITNTTPETHSVQDLLKSLDFSLGGLTPTLNSVTGVLRYIDRDGTPYQTDGVRHLSWSLKPVCDGEWQLNSRPDSEHAIVGPPTDGDYADARRSIRGSNGHNPFAAEVAIAELNVPGLGAASGPMVTVLGFGFGGNAESRGTITPGGAMEVPEPTLSFLVLAVFAGCLPRRRGRR
jgi:hypothetical protein